MAVGRGEKLFSEKHCPIKNVSPAQCRDCALAIRVLDDEEIKARQRSGELNVLEKAWQCPFKLLVLYMGATQEKLDGVSNMLEGVVEAVEALSKQGG